MEAPQIDYQNDRLTPTPTIRHAPPPVHMADYNSPSAYLNHDAYASGENTPHYDHSASSSMSLAQPASMDDLYFSYTNFGSNDNSVQPQQAQMKNDDTPVVPENQSQIPPSSYPTQPRQQEEQKPLMSPFRNGEVPVYNQQQDTPQYVDPSQNTMYFSPPAQNYYDTTQYNLHHISPQMYQPQQQQSPYYSVNPNYTYDPQSQEGSPTSSIGSSGASLARSTSTSSELRPARPKVKLTFEDKRNIVELHRSNSSLRQEDIARQYGVDRSTISKIILAQHRWTQPMEQQVQVAPKQHKAVGGRFPAIETLMHSWMDAEIAAGRDVRDNVAREKAKEFARNIGFPMERFKASAKWLDKFKERRKATGRPLSNPAMQFTYCPTQYYPDYYPRSQSDMALSSTGATTASSEMYTYNPTPNLLTTPDHQMVKTDPAMLHANTTTPLRARSQSSPQQLIASTGKIPTRMTLDRNHSYHGVSPSPRRPTALTRSNTAQMGVPLKRNKSRGGDLGAAVFGCPPPSEKKPSVGQQQQSPMVHHSPMVSADFSQHHRQRSDVSLGPFTSSMGGMTISPSISDTSDSGALNMHMAVPPLTPITPGHAAATFPEYDTTQEYIPQNIPTQHQMTYPVQDKTYAPPQPQTYHQEYTYIANGQDGGWQ